MFFSSFLTAIVFQLYTKSTRYLKWLCKCIQFVHHSNDTQLQAENLTSQMMARQNKRQRKCRLTKEYSKEFNLNLYHHYGAATSASAYQTSLFCVSKIHTDDNVIRYDIFFVEKKNHQPM